jgi:hypothetical protein
MPGEARKPLAVPSAIVSTVGIALLLRSWIRTVESQAASAPHARELGAFLVEGQRAPRL